VYNSEMWADIPILLLSCGVYNICFDDFKIQLFLTAPFMGNYEFSSVLVYFQDSVNNHQYIHNFVCMQ